MTTYDPPTVGNTHSAVKRGGKIVAHWGHATCTAADAAAYHEVPKQRLILAHDDGEDFVLFAATPEDALELLRRAYIPEFVEEFRQGIRTLYREERLPVSLATNYCPVCGGRGWDLFDYDSRGIFVIEKCATCDKYTSDFAAADASGLPFRTVDPRSLAVVDPLTYDGPCVCLPVVHPQLDPGGPRDDQG
jgi:hypothetical protein